MQLKLCSEFTPTIKEDRIKPLHNNEVSKQTKKVSLTVSYNFCILTDALSLTFALSQASMLQSLRFRLGK